jgi:anti-anti-sigma factor
MGLILSVRPAGGGVLVAVSGAVNVCTEGPLQQVLLRIMRERSARIFIDSAGLRALLITRRRAELRGGCMRLIAASTAVRRSIELNRADEALAREQEPGPFVLMSFAERT